MPETETVQGLWIGKALGAMERLSVRSFLANGHPYELYTYGPVGGVPEGAVVRDANEIIPEQEIFYCREGPGGGSPALFADLFRYKLLTDRGGWWCDLDVVCLKPFAFGEEMVLCGEWRRSGWPRRVLNNGIIRAPRNSALLAGCYRRALALGKSAVWGKTGPTLLTKQFYLSWLPRELLHLRWAPRCVQRPDVFQPVNWWEARDLVSPDRQWDLSRAHAVHLWNEVWRRGGLDKNASHDPRCLYERLKARYLGSGQS